MTRPFTYDQAVALYHAEAAGLRGRAALTAVRSATAQRKRTMPLLYLVGAVVLGMLIYFVLLAPHVH